MFFVRRLVEKNAVEEGRTRGVERRALEDETPGAEEDVLTADDELRAFASEVAEFKVGVIERKLIRPLEGFGAGDGFVEHVREADVGRHPVREVVGGEGARAEAVGVVEAVTRDDGVFSGQGDVIPQFLAEADVAPIAE